VVDAGSGLEREIWYSEVSFLVRFKVLILLHCNKTQELVTEKTLHENRNERFVR
jgi:hypothetical protein